MEAEVGKPVATTDGKWAFTLHTYIHRCGLRVRSNSITSDPVYETRMAAITGGEQVVQIVAQTGQIPDIHKGY